MARKWRTSSPAAVSLPVLLVLGLSVGWFCVAADSGPAPAFDLPRWASNERVQLGDFAGQVLVLDFFAYWCAPCAAASTELERGIQLFYAARSGNPHGLRVRVLSVNVEKEKPEETEAFLQRTHASFVADDPSGSLLQTFGQQGLPFVVIVDGSAGRPDGTGFRVVYQQGGFEGSGRLRRIIDGLGSPGAAVNPAPVTEHVERGLPLVQVAELDTEFLGASDIFLTDSRLRYDYERGNTQWDVAFDFSTFDEDYQPYRQVDFFGFPEHLHENRYSGFGNLRQRVSDRLTLLGSASIVDGYKDYKRVWIANRYRQKYDNPAFPRVPGYEDPSPGQWSAMAGLRWEYLPTVGFAELKPSYSHERAAPGYEDGTNSMGNYRLVRGRVNIDTYSVAFASENILTRWLRMRHDFSLGQSTGRELRFSYQGSVNLALGERWVLRGYGGLTTEAPNFDATFFSLTAEYELLPHLLVSVSGRYYSDTGEIETSLPITSAAPPLRSWDFGAGLRYAQGRFAAKLYGGPLWTDYRPQPGIGQEFTYLYADRNWVLVQFACSLQF